MLSDKMRNIIKMFISRYSKMMRYLELPFQNFTVLELTVDYAQAGNGTHVIVVKG